MEQHPCFLVAVHVGAGSHARSKEEKYKAVMQAACKAATTAALQQQQQQQPDSSVLPLVKAAVQVLEVCVA